MTPTATVGGEVIRVRMLDGRVDSTAAWASVAIAKIAQTVSQLVFIAIGLPIVAREVELPPAVRAGLFVGLGLIATGVVIAVMLQRRGMFGAASGLARRLGIHVPVRLSSQLRLLDAEIARFHAAPVAFLASCACFFAGWMVGVLEVYLILLFLDVGASFTRALVIEVLSMAIDAVLFLVPARAGTQEGGKVLIFGILGLDAAKGLALGLARRIRELAWALVGLAILWRAQSRRPG